MSLNVTRNRRTNLLLHLLLLLLVNLTIINHSIFAEGSPELAPGNADRVFLYLNGEFYNSFGRYDGNADQRLFFHIANPDQEQVYLGFSQSTSSGHYPCRGFENISYFRIKDPNGNIVYPNRNDPMGQILDRNSANITSKAQAAIGPAPISGAAGYTPFVFDPSGLQAGDYYIEFSAIANQPAPNIVTAIEHWDITVATKTASPSAIDGRVFAINWSFYSPSISCGSNTNYSWFDRPFNGQFYVLSREGFVNLVDFQGAGFQPAAFNLYFNETGPKNTGTPIEDRKSIVGLGTNQALQKVFLNNPDPLVYPSGEYGTINSTPELHICEQKDDACILVAPTKPGQIEVLIDFDTTNGAFKYDQGSRDVLLVFSIIPEPNETAPYERCIPWDGRDGFGDLALTGNSYDMQITFQQGVYHLPVYDVEYFLNGISATNIRPIPPSGSNARKLYYDDSNISFSPGNGSSQVELNGCIPPCHTWTNKEYGDKNTINTWFFAEQERRIKGETPNCLIEARNDSATTPFETSVSIPVVNNDIGTVIDTSSVSVTFSTPNAENISIGTDGIVQYIPAMGFMGLDSFQYSICYDILPRNSFCDEAFVYINVGPSRETNCEDGIDNDRDGFIDCDDSDCLPNPGPILRKRE